MSAPTPLEAFEVNGIRMLVDAPHEFLNQAHAVIDALVSEMEGSCGGRPTTVLSLGRAADTLLWLSRFGLHRYDEARLEDEK